MGFDMSKLNFGALGLAKYIVPAVGLVPLAFGISFALGKLAPEKAQAALNETPARHSPVSGGASRIALVIGNSDYPDANTPLRQPVKDAQALAEQLRRSGFDVDVHENLGKEEMTRAVESFTAKIRPGSVAFVSFGGFGIQVGRQSYMVPVNAQIWKEADVRRDGISIDSVLTEMHNRGASVKLAIIDASRRNPFERRFRGVSSGLAAIDAPQGTLMMSAAAPGKVAYDVDGEHSLLIGELLKEINAPGVSAEVVFNHTRVGVSRASNGEQVPQVSSSLIETFAFVDGGSRYARSKHTSHVEPPRAESPKFVARTDHVDTPRYAKRTDDAETPRYAVRTDYVDTPAAQVNDAVDLTTSAAATQPADATPPKPAAVDKPAQVQTAPKRPVEKPVPAAKETKTSKVAEHSKRQRRTYDASREYYEEPRPFIHHKRLFSSPPHFGRPFRMAGPFGRPSFGRFGMGF
jgi:Caspase domain